MASGVIVPHLDTGGGEALLFYFYEHHGYKVFGTLEGFPPGAQQHFLRKRLRVRSQSSRSRIFLITH